MYYIHIHIFVSRYLAGIHRDRDEQKDEVQRPSWTIFWMIQCCTSTTLLLLSKFELVLLQYTTEHLIDIGVSKCIDDTSVHIRRENDVEVQSRAPSWTVFPNVGRSNACWFFDRRIGLNSVNTVPYIQSTYACLYGEVLMIPAYIFIVIKTIRCRGSKPSSILDHFPECWTK